MNRVYTLYRVSTKQQVDKTKDDIPMQTGSKNVFPLRNIGYGRMGKMIYMIILQTL